MALGGLLAAVVAGFGGRRAAAQQGWVPIGGACYDTGQCGQAGDLGFAYCADHGFAYDGPLNCSAFYGDRCATDEGCCGYPSLLRRYLRLADTDDDGGGLGVVSS